MIEQAVVVWLNSVAAVTTALGGAKVYYHRAPTNMKMPWVVITNSGGSRDRITQAFTEARDTLTIYVEAENAISGRVIAEKVRQALENYRGDMAPMHDVFIECDSIRDLDGFNTSFRYIIAAYVRYRETTAYPN
jgi:hypothetical protein